MSLHQLTAHSLLDLLKSGKTSPKEAYTGVLDRIKAIDPRSKPMYIWAIKSRIFLGECRTHCY